MPEFLQVLPDQVASLTFEIRDLIERTVHDDELADFTANDLLASVKLGSGLLYLIQHNDEYEGYIYYHSNGHTLNVAMLGGNVLQWKAALKQHTIHVGQALGCKKILIMSREGWGKIFPELQPVGYIYEFDIPLVNIH